MAIEGEVVFVLAYSGVGGTVVFFDLDFHSPDSGVVFSKMIEGNLEFASAYSGDVGTMTIVGVSFRTGLRG